MPILNTGVILHAVDPRGDPGGFDAAKALGARMSNHKSIDRGIVEGFLLCTSRPPTAFEKGRLATLYKNLRAKYNSSPSESKKIAATTEAAAWTMVANTLLNLDEAVTKE